MASVNVYKKIAKADMAALVKDKLENSYVSTLVGLFRQNAVDWAGFNNQPIDWAQVAAGEATFKGYATKIVVAGNFTLGASGDSYNYAEISLNFVYDSQAAQGDANNVVTHFAVGVDDGVNGLKVWYVGQLPQAVTLQADGDVVAFKLRLAFFSAALANAIDS